LVKIYKIIKSSIMCRRCIRFIE